MADSSPAKEARKPQEARDTVGSRLIFFNFNPEKFENIRKHKV